MSWHQWTYAGKDSCIRHFTGFIQAARPNLDPMSRVLEIGCAEGDWLGPAVKSWPQMLFTGIDWRGVVRPCEVIQGDVMAHDFPDASFDLIVMVSALEHIGLGHYNHDPGREDGDSETMRRVHRWLKPGGWVFFDVPWNAGTESYHVAGTTCRVYDDTRVVSRLDQGLGWTWHWRGWMPEKGHDLSTMAPSRQFTPDEMNRKKFHVAGFWWRKPLQ